MPPVITRSEYLEVNGIPLATPAWEATDLSDLYDAASVRGDDRIIPYKPGVSPLPRVRDALRAQIPIDVYGEFDQDGDPHSDPAMGLIINLDTLKAGIFETSTVGDGTVPIIWHLPDGSTRTADGMVLPPYDPELLQVGSMAIIMDLSIPSGVFTEGS